jgi:hypothetical protein
LTAAFASDDRLAMAEGEMSRIQRPLTWSAFMNRREYVRARLQSVNESLARLRAERSRLLARATQTERKRDTRQKILIGAAVLAAVQHEGVPPLRNSDDLVAWLEPRLTRPHDRAAFNFGHGDAATQSASLEWPR